MNQEYAAFKRSININRYMISKQVCKNKTVLDMACGEGYGSYLLKKWGAKCVDGIDSDLQKIEKANKNFKESDVSFLCFNAEELSAKLDKKYDLIVLFESLETIKNSSSYIRSIKELATEDAIIIVSSPIKSDQHDNKTVYTVNDFIGSTEEVLGKSAQCFIGAPTNGYITVNAQNHDVVDAASSLITEVCLDEMKNNNTYSYFVGVWQSELKGTSIVFPTTVATNDVEEQNKEIECLLEEIAFLKEDANVKLTQTMKARYEIILESLQRENDILRVRMYDLTQKENQLNAIIHSRLYRMLLKIKKVIRRR